MGSKVEKARRQVEKYAKVEEQWARRGSELEDELRALETGAGAAMLEAALSGDGQGKASEIAERTTRLRSELEATKRAAAAAQEARESRERDVFGARAAEMRAKAKGIRSSAAELKAKSDRKLAELRELEGVVYVPEKPDRPSLLGHEGGAPLMVVIPIPRSEAMIQEAEKLERGAERLEAKARGEDVGPAPVGIVTGEILVPAEAV